MTDLNSLFAYKVSQEAPKLDYGEEVGVYNNDTQVRENIEKLPLFAQLKFTCSGPATGHVTETGGGAYRTDNHYDLSGCTDGD